MPSIQPGICDYIRTEINDHLVVKYKFIRQFRTTPLHALDANQKAHVFLLSSKSNPARSTRYVRLFLPCHTNNHSTNPVSHDWCSGCSILDTPHATGHAGYVISSQYLDRFRQASYEHGATERFQMFVIKMVVLGIKMRIHTTAINKGTA